MSENEPLLSIAPTLPEPESEPQPTKPEKDAHMSLRAVAQDGTEVAFRVSPNTNLDKLMSAYCSRTGARPDTVRFLYDGQRIGKGVTPDDLGMEDGDIVDVVLQQVGGALLFY